MIDGFNSETIRPQNFDDFVGQGALKENLKIFIKAAKKRDESLDHTIFYGPPGLGKTTLSHIIAAEMGVNIKMSSGPVITKSGDLAAILTSIQEKDVLFIDEIHRLPKAIEEVLYSAMEDFAIDVIIGEGPSARSLRINLPKFTLVGATTRLGLLSNPLRDRFGIPMKIEFYSIDELHLVLERYIKIFNMTVESDAISLIAKCSRGTPRIAIRLLRRIRDFADNDYVTLNHVKKALANLDIDEYGLDKLDRSYLNYIYTNYKGGPVGIDTIAAGLSEDRGTLEDTVEPYLLQLGFIARTPRGRTLTSTSLKILM